MKFQFPCVMNETVLRCATSDHVVKMRYSLNKWVPPANSTTQTHPRNSRVTTISNFFFFKSMRWTEGCKSRSPTGSWLRFWLFQKTGALRYTCKSLRPALFHTTTPQESSNVPCKWNTTPLSLRRGGVYLNDNIAFSENDTQDEEKPRYGLWMGKLGLIVQSRCK